MDIDWGALAAEAQPEADPTRFRAVRITKIDLNRVKQDCHDNGVNTKHFNTSFHPIEDIPSSHPECFDLTQVPSEKPYRFGRWVDLIARQHNLEKNSFWVIRLTRPQAKHLLDAMSVSIVTRELSHVHKDHFKKWLNPSLSVISFGKDGIFVRLNDCSPEDGVQARANDPSIRTIRELLLRLTTSDRTRTAITQELACMTQRIDLFCLPFDSRFSTENEYRVFCCAVTGRITGVSQYQWHKPWIYADVLREEKCKIVDSIIKGIKSVHKTILVELLSKKKKDEKNGAEVEAFLSQGFTFDVAYDPTPNSPSSQNEGSDFLLVNLNAFGPRSACGSCLFHWIADADQLHKQSCNVIEFRYTS